MKLGYALGMVGLLLLTSCSDGHNLIFNNDTRQDNNSTGSNNGTTPDNNGTSPTNNGSSNNGTTPSNNGTTPNCDPSVCVGICVMDMCVPASCDNDVQDSGESDVDCGGGCSPCGIGRNCLFSTDCTTGLCEEDRCALESCVDPGGTERFEPWDIGFNMSVTYEIQIAGGPVLAASIAMEDFDGDDDLDLVFSNTMESAAYLENDGAGNFTNRTGGSPFATLADTTSIAVADIDNDGDSDIFFGRLGGMYLLLNDGSGNFTDVTSAWGLDEIHDSVAGGSFGDYDGDGRVDLYVSNYVPDFNGRLEGEGNALYRNAGTRFQRIPNSPGEASKGMTLSSSWIDINKDGRLDIWNVNDFGPLLVANEVWLNMGESSSAPGTWVFTESADTYDFDHRMYGMSAVVVDVDNDGDADYYSSNIANNVLMIDDNGTFRDEASARGAASGGYPDPAFPSDSNIFSPNGSPIDDLFTLKYVDIPANLPTLTSWGIIFFDYDHDGDSDLFVANGTVEQGFLPDIIRQPNLLFENDGSGVFTPAPCHYLPVSRESSRGAVAGDLDGDGDEDIVYVNMNMNQSIGGVVVLRNQVPTTSWIDIKLRGSTSNRDGIGAKVTLTSAGQSQTKWVSGGQGYTTASPKQMHFGIGSATSIDQVEILWPSGARQTVPSLATNQLHVITEP